MRFRTLIRNVEWKEAAGVVALVALATLLWNTGWVYPLKILVVFFHEMSHGLAAILTGGSVERIEVVAEEGGQALVLGGSSFWVATAGYLGSLLWGGLILVLVARTRRPQWISVVLGTALIGVTLWLVRPFLGFGFLFGLGAGAALVAIGLWLGHWLNEILLELIGLTSCLYAVLDIKSDVLDRPELRSDAAMLAEQTGVPTVVWGVVWIAIAVVVGGWLLLFACQRRRPARAPRTTELPQV